ncbi:MAG TPA: DUF3093 domain-containing protein [Propionibacteriaceae bacterium]|nr:DUF3093 domain-containing protein [Propionibacteriaceae bacterium]
MLFRERLTVPIIWWVLAGLFSLSVLVAVGTYLGPAWGLGTSIATLLVAASIFGSAAILISVDEQEIRVGRASIEHAYIATCRALDAEQTRRRTGVEADARAHLVLRPYIKTTVEITLDDPEDPVPYWLVSTRHPQRLAAALQDAASSTLTE